jgi:uncharacterized membrane protein
MFPIRLNELHPIMVHFPIALLLTSSALDFIAVLLRRRTLVEGATWCLALGVVGLLASGITGKIARGGAANTAAVAQLIELHSHLANLTSAVFTSLLSVRLAWLAPRVLATARPVLPGSVVALELRARKELPWLYAAWPPGIFIALYLTASLIGVILLALTGYLGGELVYAHGVGIA